MIAILDGVRSAHNVGSIFRTADAVGIERLCLCGITPAPIDEYGRPRGRLTKVSLGAEKHVSWEKAGRTPQLLDKLKRKGYAIFVIEQSKASVPYFKVRPGRKRIALVVGNEVKGLPKAVLKKADTILEIPMRGKKESLNVSVAFGIVAFHLAKSK